MMMASVVLGNHTGSCSGVVGLPYGSCTVCSLPRLPYSGTFPACRIHYPFAWLSAIIKHSATTILINTSDAYTPPTMSEYWKSTPKYWCKHCSVYVRDTKLERANHESTGKHQGAIKRSLRDLHRSAEQEQREKDRAKREVERLNGVVSASGSGSGGAGAKKHGSSTSSAPPPAAPTGQLSQAERQRQLEQLAELGVNIPTELRKDMAMVGEWSVTSTRVVDDGDSGNKTADDTKDEGRAVGVKRERERTEEEKEQEEALNGLFKKRKRWGVGSKSMPEEEDKELEELLSGTIVKTKKEKDTEVKGEVKGEEGVPEAPVVKKEESQDGPALEAIQAVQDEAPPAMVKQELGNEEPAVAAVVFKKRKPKNIRQK